MASGRDQNAERSRLAQRYFPNPPTIPIWKAYLSKVAQCSEIIYQIRHLLEMVEKIRKLLFLR